MSQTPERGQAARSPADDQRVAAVAREHTPALLRVARRHSRSPDAVQRALEIYVKRLARLDPATELAWLKVVVKHDAMPIRRARRDLAPDPDWDADHHEAAQQGVHERPRPPNAPSGPPRRCARSSPTTRSPCCSRPRGTPTTRSPKASAGHTNV